jgi:hypothetical protein
MRGLWRRSIITERKRSSGKVRHVRMLWLCLAAVFAVAAVAATSASAKKDPYNPNTVEQFKYCPYEEEGPFHNPGVEDCYVGRTSGGRQGGFFEFGKITVKLSKPIILQGGATGEGEGVFVSPAAHGGETLEAPELPVTGGLKVITAAIQEEAGWPQALKESFKAAVKAKETAVDVKIEVAGGNTLYETEGALDSEKILLEEGDAYKLPLKVKVTSPWLASLGGGPCYIGNDAYPVWQHLTTGGAGTAGSFHFNESFTAVELQDSTLVDTGWHIEAGSAPSGCGGEYESYVDAALSDVLEIHPWKTGITVLKGDLFIASRQEVKERAEKGEL